MSNAASAPHPDRAQDPKVRAALETLLAAPEPASSVDLAVVRRDGRRIRRRRAAASSLTASAATVLVVAAVAGGLTLTGTAAPVRAAAGSGPAPAALTGSDPVVVAAEFGWLPAGAKVVDRGWSAGDSTMAASLVPATTYSADASMVDLTVHTGGEPPLGFLPGGVPAVRIPAAAVDGDPAYWLVQPRPGPATKDQDVILRWRYAPAGWAELEVNGLSSSADFTALVYRIAEGVTFGHSDPVAMPFHVSGLPAGLKVQTGESDIAPAEYGGSSPYTWAAGIGSVGDSAPSAGGWQITTQPYLPVAPGGPDAGSATTVDGHRAQATKSGLVVFDVDGMTVSITASGPPLAAIDSIGGFVALYHRLTLLGADQADWTTHVLG